ncbi:MAG: aldo/keto reductase family protein [Planctomycetota bacterium]
MEYRRLGHSGLKVSAIGLGTWLNFGDHLGDREAGRIVRRALEGGVNLIDTADAYADGKAEDQLGRVLEGVRRESYVLATKAFFPMGTGPNDKGLSRKHLFESVHASLRRLRTETIDLFQCHRHDPETPVEETVRAFGDLIRQGKVHYWGVSVWTAAQIEEAVAAARAVGAPPPASNQPPYSLLNREIEADVVPACRRHGLGILPFSPLAQGVLTGKYLDGARPAGSRVTDARRSGFMRRYLEEEQTRKVARMRDLAKQRGIPMARAALGWVLANPIVASVLVGVTTEKQVEENLAAAGTPLDEGLKAELDLVFARA